MQSFLLLPHSILHIHCEASWEAIWILLLYTINSVPLNFTSKIKCCIRCILKCLHAFYFKYDCPPASISLTIYSCFTWPEIALWFGFFSRVSFVFPVVADNDTAVHPEGWHPAACSKPNLDSHFTVRASVVLHACFLSAIFVATKAWERLKGEGRMTSPWTGYSQLDESISYIVCRNRFSSISTCVSIGKGCNFAIKY